MSEYATLITYFCETHKGYRPRDALQFYECWEIEPHPKAEDEYCRLCFERTIAKYYLVASVPLINTNEKPLKNGEIKECDNCGAEVRRGQPEPCSRCGE